MPEIFGKTSTLPEAVSQAERLHQAVRGDRSIVIDGGELAKGAWMAGHSSELMTLFANLGLGRPDRRLYRSLVGDLDKQAKDLDRSGAPRLAEALRQLKGKLAGYYTDVGRKQEREVTFISCPKCGGPVGGGVACCPWCEAGMEIR